MTDPDSVSADQTAGGAGTMGEWDEEEAGQGGEGEGGVAADGQSTNGEPTRERESILGMGGGKHVLKEMFGREYEERWKAFEEKTWERVTREAELEEGEWERLREMAKEEARERVEEEARERAKLEGSIDDDTDGVIQMKEGEEDLEERGGEQRENPEGEYRESEESEEREHQEDAEERERWERERQEKEHQEREEKEWLEREEMERQEREERERKEREEREREERERQERERQEREEREHRKKTERELCERQEREHQERECWEREMEGLAREATEYEKRVTSQEEGEHESVSQQQLGGVQQEEEQPGKYEKDPTEAMIGADTTMLDPSSVTGERFDQLQPSLEMGISPQSYNLHTTLGMGEPDAEWHAFSADSSPMTYGREGRILQPHDETEERASPLNQGQPSLGSCPRECSCEEATPPPYDCRVEYIPPPGFEKSWWYHSFVVAVRDTVLNTLPKRWAKWVCSNVSASMKRLTLQVACIIPLVCCLEAVGID